MKPSAALNPIRPPKVATDAERATLGSMLVEAPAVLAARDILDVLDFYEDDHRTIYKAMLEIFARDGVVDLVTVAHRLREQKKLADLGTQINSKGMAYLTDLIHVVSTAAHVEHYARIVREASLDRQIEAQLKRTAADKTMENESQLRDLLLTRDAVYAGAIFDFQKDLHAAIEALEKKRNDVIDTGFTSLDAILGGVEEGEVLTVGARTSGGKTAWMVKACLQMAEAAFRARRTDKFLYLTTEMSENQIVGRILPAAAGIPSWKFRRRDLKPEDHARISAVCGDRLSKLALLIKGKSQMSLKEIRTYAVRSGAKTIFFDYLQRADLSGSRADNRAYQMMDFMIGLKTIAQDLHARIIVGCQLDRKLDKNTTAEPELSDLKDSGAIEAESAQVILLWRENAKELLKKAKGDQPPKDHHVIRCKVAKNRNGGSAGEAADFLLHGPYVDMVERFTPKEKQGHLPIGGHDEHP